MFCKILDFGIAFQSMVLYGIALLLSSFGRQNSYFLDLCEFFGMLNAGNVDK